MLGFFPFFQHDREILAYISKQFDIRLRYYHTIIEIKMSNNPTTTSSLEEHQENLVGVSRIETLIESFDGD